MKIKKINPRKINLIFTLLSIFLFTLSCSKSPSSSKNSTTPDEKIWLEKFFKDLLLEESGIYTLWGTKPITAFEMCLYTPEELKKIQEKSLRGTKQETVVFRDYNFPENWKKWEEISDRYNVQKYMLFKKDNPDDPKLPMIFFVNILEAALTIQNNYHLFRKEVGYDFDSLDEVFDIENPDSKFWEKVFNNSKLMGILYGFGIKNASCFHWKFRKRQKKNPFFLKALHYRFSDTLLHPNLSSINLFSLPIFSSFSDDDEILEKYKLEKKKIEKAYKNRDFVQVTLEKLTG
jgi:hypothetical protein